MPKNVLLINEMDFSDQVYKGLEALKDQYDLRFFLISDMDFEPRRPLFEKRYVFDICDTLNTIKFIRNQGIKFDTVQTKSCELVTPLVALLNREFGNIGNDPKTAFLCRSKYHMRQALAEAGVAQPKFMLAKNRREVEEAVRKIGTPCVVKPVGGHSSFGTFMVRDSKDASKVGEEYDRCIQYMLELSQMELKQMADFSEEELEMMGVEERVNMITDYVVEEYMEGPEISVDALVQDGKATLMGIEEQVRMQPPYFIQLAARLPYQTTPERNAEIQALVRKTIKALGIQNSATHTEIIFTPEGPKVVEIGCRIGADDLHDAILSATGTHLLSELILIGLGVQRNFDIKTLRHTTMEYLLPKVAGTVERIETDPSFKGDPDINHVFFSVKPGDKVAPPPENFDYLGYVSVSGNTPELAQKKLREVVDKIKVTIQA